MDTSFIAQTLHVLIVDGSPTIRSLLGGVLVHGKVGSVIEAASGEDGLSLLKEPTCRINIVICDWSLPSMSGLEFCRSLKLEKPTTPVLMLAEGSDTKAIDLAREAGVDGYLPKPISPSELLQNICIVVRSRSALAE